MIKQRLKHFYIFLLVVLFFTNIPGKVMAQATDEGTNYWELSLEELQNIQITTATKTEQSLEMAPSIVTVITGEEIIKSGFKNIEEVLRQVVGLDLVAKEYQALSYVGVRGIFSTGSNNKTKIMLNGHMMQSVVGDMFFHFNTIPIDNIKQIEVIRGPGSALYGTNAFSGVINVITNENSSPLAITLKSGSFQTISPSLETNIKKEKFQFHLFSNYYQSKGPSSLIESDFASKTFGEKHSAAPGYTTESSSYYTVQTDLSYGNFYAKAYFQDLNIENPVGYTLSLVDDDVSHSIIGYGELGYVQPIKNGKITAKVYSDYHYYDAIIELFSEETSQFFSGMYPNNIPYPTDEGVFLSGGSSLGVIGSELNLDLKLFDGLNILLGGSYEYLNLYNVRTFYNGNISGQAVQLDGSTFQPFQYYGSQRDVSETMSWIQPSERSTGALFGQTMLNINELFGLKKNARIFDLILGLRYDNYSDVSSSINPRTGLVFGYSDQLSFKVLYGRAFKVPFFHETSQNSGVSYGRRDLRPEHLHTLEFSTAYTFDENIKGNLTLFRIRANDLILRNAGGTYSNFGSFRSSGMEAELKIRNSKSNYGYINFTYQDVKNTTHALITNSEGENYEQKDIYSGRTPNVIANFGYNYQISKKLNINASTNFVGERFRSDEKTYNINDQLVHKDEREDLPARTLVTGSILYSNFLKKHRGFSIQLTGYNLLNSNHRDPEPSGKVLNDIPRAGRNFMIQLKYKIN